MRLIVSYGGGDNSAAMVVGLYEHGERPDAIVFADTGGEKPHTYRHIWKWMQPWTERVGFPSITIVRGEQPQQITDGSLEAQQLRLRSIPSRAFGYGQCSREWKIVPQERWAERIFGLGYVKLIGFHADEEHRVLRSKALGYTLRYPLIEWGWGPAECATAMIRVGIPQPGKSACFFCPSSRPSQVRDLRTRYPDLVERALEMESRWLESDGGGAVKGLGRHWSWGALLAQQELLVLPTPDECGEGCFT